MGGVFASKAKDHICSANRSDGSEFRTFSSLPGAEKSRQESGGDGVSLPGHRPFGTGAGKVSGEAVLGGTASCLQASCCAPLIESAWSGPSSPRPVASETGCVRRTARKVWGLHPCGPVSPSPSTGAPAALPVVQGSPELTWEPRLAFTFSND